MFDANMRYLPKDFEFFGEVHYCKGGFLERFGLKSGDLVRCKMLDEDHKNPRVVFYHDGLEVVGSHDLDYYETLMVYGGTLQGTGFINKETKAKALEILGGEWVE